MPTVKRGQRRGGFSFGDIYNALASDGDERPGAYFAKATLKRGVYAYTIQTHHSVYATTHEGAKVFTVAHTVEGRTVILPWFTAQDETTELRIERRLGLLGLYGGIGVARPSANYAYPLGYKLANFEGGVPTPMAVQQKMFALEDAETVADVTKVHEAILKRTPERRAL